MQDVAKRRLESLARQVCFGSNWGGGDGGDGGDGGGLGRDEEKLVKIFQHAQKSVVFIQRRGERERSKGTGSGFLWNAQHVVTNAHVALGMGSRGRYQVVLHGHQCVEAELVGADEEGDIALLRIVNDNGEEGGGSQRKPLRRMGAKTSVAVGQTVLAIGNPFGLDSTLTRGIISGLGRELPTAKGYTLRDLIQTDAAINPGNSGGPLLNSSGYVIGVTTAIMSPSGASAGIGFAIPIATVEAIVSDLLRYGRVQRPRLGIVMATNADYYRLRRENAAHTLLPEGVLVLAVSGAAKQAGVRQSRKSRRGNLVLGDIITAFEGEKVRFSQELQSAVRKSKVGQRVSLSVFRDGRSLTLEATLQGREEGESEEIVD